MQYWRYDNHDVSMTTVSKPPKPRKQRVKNGGVVGASLLSLIPASEIENHRRSIFNIVKQNTGRVREVLVGTRQWNPQQLKLYLALLDKVMPDLVHNHNTSDQHRNVEELTPDELREILAQELAKQDALKNTLPPIEAIEAEEDFSDHCASTLNDPLSLTLDPDQT